MINPSDNPAEEFIRQLKKALLPSFLNEIPDDYFQPGHEEELKKRVIEIIDACLVRDKVPIGRQLRLRFIESVMADITAGRKRFFDGP